QGARRVHGARSRDDATPRLQGGVDEGPGARQPPRGLAREAPRGRSVHARHGARGPAPRRQRLLRGISRGTLLARLEDHRDLRRHERDPEGHCRRRDPGPLMDWRLATAAALLALQGIGFGVPCVIGIRSVAAGEGVPLVMGFPSYGGGPFERVGIPTTVPLLVAFLVVGILEGVAAGLVLAGFRVGAILAFALL